MSEHKFLVKSQILVIFQFFSQNPGFCQFFIRLLGFETYPEKKLS